MKSKMTAQVKGTLFSNKDLRDLILPLVLEQALALTVGMADTMMIANAGEAAVSGVSLVDMLNNLIISVLAALATGGAVVTSQYLGAGRRNEACRSVSQLVVSSLVITVVISAFMILLNRPIVHLFFGKIEEDVFENAVLYLLVSAISYPFLSVYNSAAAIFRAMNKSDVTLKVSILMNVINVAGNAIGIFVLHAGVLGVAVPSLISRAVAAAVMFALLFNDKLEIHIVKERYKVNFPVIRKILAIGIPSGIENGIFQLGRVVVVSIIATFGTVQIAANGVANSLDGMEIIGGQAMNLAIITVIGRCVGAGDEDQVRYYTKKMIVIAYAFTAVISGTIMANLGWILKLYNLSAETTRLSLILVLMHGSFAILMWPMSFTFPNMLRSCNDVQYPMIVSIISMIVFRIGMSLVLAVGFKMGAIGVWIAMIIDWVCRITCFVLRYRSGKWRVRAGFVRDEKNLKLKMRDSAD